MPSVPRAVTTDAARRRRDRLAELIDALGIARGRKVTQREFAASIGREQGTVAAILGGHRSLGGDVMLAVVQAYRLPGDYFDSPLRPDPRPFARAALQGLSPTPSVGNIASSASPAMGPVAQAISPAVPPRTRAPEGGDGGLRAGGGDGALAEVVAGFQPDRAVAMALEALARKGARFDQDGWVRLLLGAQSAHEHGVLVDWYDRTLGALVVEPEPAEVAVLPVTLVREGNSAPKTRAGRRGSK